jgi:hypothetical protein
MIAAMAAAVRTASTFRLLSGFEGASDAAGFCCGAGVDCDAGVASATSAMGFTVGCDSSCFLGPLRAKLMTPGEFQTLERFLPKRPS